MTKQTNVYEMQIWHLACKSCYGVLHAVGVKEDAPGNRYKKRLPGGMEGRRRGKMKKGKSSLIQCLESLSFKDFWA